MTVIEIPRRVDRECIGCGEVFQDVEGGPRRLYCDECRPRPLVRRRVAPAEVQGRAFSWAHFYRWSRQLRLREGRFSIERWEEQFVRDVLAAIRGSGVKELWLLVPEGNGKSTLVSLLVLYCVQFADEAKIPVAASARDQAEIIFQQGAGFVRRTPELAGVRAMPGVRELRLGASYAKIYAGDAGTGDGVIPYPLMVIDELHRHQSLELYRTWAGKLDKEGAVLVVISTAGAPQSDFEETRQAIRESATEIRVEGCYGRYGSATAILHEYAVPADGNPLDLDLVKAANPSRRVTVKGLEAKRSRPSWSLPHWKRLTCNQPADPTGAGIPPAVWAAAYAEGAVIPPGEPIWYGADYAWVLDTTAIVPFWVRDRDFRLLGAAEILMPPGDGSQLSVDAVKSAWLRLLERNPALGIVMDMSGARDISQWLEDELGCLVIDRTQTNTMAVLDYTYWMEGLRNRWLWHSGDDGLKQHVLNARTKLLPGGETRFVRPQESRTVRAEARARRVIDALTAGSMVNASVGVTLAEPDEVMPLVAFV